MISTQTKAYLEPSFTGRGRYNQFANPSPVRNSGRWPRLWQLPWVLFRTQDVLLLHEPSHCIFRAIWHPWQYTIPHRHYCGHSFYAPNLLYLLKGRLLGIVPGRWNQLPDFQGVSVPHEPKCGKQWGQFQSLRGKPKCLTPWELIDDYPPFGFPLSKP